MENLRPGISGDDNADDNGDDGDDDDGDDGGNDNRSGSYFLSHLYITSCLHSTAHINLLSLTTQQGGPCLCFIDGEVLT